MKATELENLIFNPNYTGRIIHHFLSGFKSINAEGVKSELIYIVLPFIYESKVCEKLINLNKNSKLNTILNEQVIESFFCQINSKILEYKKNTKNSLYNAPKNQDSLIA